MLLTRVDHLAIKGNTTVKAENIATPRKLSENKKIKFYQSTLEVTIQFCIFSTPIPDKVNIISRLEANKKKPHK